MLKILDPQIFQSANNLTILNCYLIKVFTAGNSEMSTFKGVNALKMIFIKHHLYLHLTKVSLHGSEVNFHGSWASLYVSRVSLNDFRVSLNY